MRIRNGQCFPYPALSEAALPWKLCSRQGRVSDDPICFGAVLGLVEMVEVPVSRLERQGRLMRVLESVCRDVDRKGMCSSEPDRVRRVRRFLEERCAEDVPLSTLAQLAGCSPWRLNRDFASGLWVCRRMNIRPCNGVRMVKECIRDGKSLAESGVEAGFADQSHMTRCFKKGHGHDAGKICLRVAIFPFKLIFFVSLL